MFYFNEINHLSKIVLNSGCGPPQSLPSFTEVYGVQDKHFEFACKYLMAQTICILFFDQNNIFRHT